MKFYVLLAFQVEMNTGSLSPFGCFYCRTSFLNFTEAIIHSTSSHDSLVLKAKSLELNSSTGKIGYIIHNFNVIPKELKLQVSQYKLILQMTSYLFASREQGVKKLQYLVPLVKKVVSALHCSH